MVGGARALFWGLVFVVAVGLAGCAQRMQVRSPAGTTTTVVLIRHADRFPGFPGLSDAGHARAAALPGALAGLEIQAIYSPDLERNLATVEPLAQERGIEVTVVEVSGVAARLVGENPGKAVLWVGNTDNLENIFLELGGEGPPPNNYGDLYILKVPDGGPTDITRSRFGAVPANPGTSQ